MKIRIPVLLERCAYCTGIPAAILMAVCMGGGSSLLVDGHGPMSCRAESIYNVLLVAGLGLMALSLILIVISSFLSPPEA